MDPAQFFTAAPVTIVAGKGGVGKTTVTATLAAAASSVGLDVMIVEIEGKSQLSRLFGEESLSYDEIELRAGRPEAGIGRIWGRTLTPDQALVEYLGKNGLGRISKRLSESGALDMVTTATPGIKDVLILGKIKQIERDHEADLILVDAPAAGHAISFLRSASGLKDAVSVGPIRNQANEVIELLTDESRCRVILSTLAEETPVNEAVETAFSLEDQVGVKLGPIVINGVYPDRELSDSFAAAAKAAGVKVSAAERDRLDAAATFWRQRSESQLDQIGRLADALPLPQIRLPFIFAGELDPHSLEQLAEATLAALGDLAPAGAA